MAQIVGAGEGNCHKFIESGRGSLVDCHPHLSTFCAFGGQCRIDMSSYNVA